MTGKALSWGEFRNGLQEWIAILAGEPGACIVWLDEGKPISDPIIVLSGTADKDHSILNSTDLTTGDAVETTEVVKQMTIQCRVETCAQTSYSGALQIADRIRLRSFLPSFRNKLADGIVPYTEPTGLTNMAYDASGQRVQVRTFDMFLRFKLIETFTDTEADWFDKMAFNVTENPGAIQYPVTEVP